MLSKNINPNISSYRGVNTDCATSAANAAVNIFKDAEPTADRVWVLDSIQYSYTGTTITGGLLVDVGGNTKLDVDITTNSGLFHLYIPSQTDKRITVTLKAGGSGVIGKLNTQMHLEQGA